MCSVLTNGFFVPKLHWHLPNPGRICWKPQKHNQKECLGVASVIMFASSDIDGLDYWTIINYCLLLDINSWIVVVHCQEYVMKCEAHTI